jgi:indolepyruvate ferredoxin oxidoreductase
LAYKDEYEVARLHLESAAKAQAEFEGDLRLTYHLAPPLLSRMGPDGRPVKRAFGPWIMRAFRLLARLKGLRGTRLDPFGYLPERRLERALIAQYEADMAEVLAALTPATLGVARELAELPLSIRGFGPLKEAAAKAAATRREALLATFRAGGTPQQHAAE